MVLYSITFLFGAVAYSQAILLSREVCYADLGCFGTDPPFRSIRRPILFLPDSPDEIGTTFHLYTRANPSPTEKDTLVAGNRRMLRTSHYLSGKSTKFIIHGFLTTVEHPWIQQMVRELLRNDNMNVVVVDWEVGARPSYTQATANTRVVGAQIAQLIQFLMSETGNLNSSFHLIGHSLGSHTAGYAGERIPGLGRISGLDPAEPYFEHTDPAVRLDPTDAEFVDVIHTDGTSILKPGFGVDQPLGHVDFFPNGGKEQPGCESSLWQRLAGVVWNAVNLDMLGVMQAAVCSHMFASDAYTESINSQCQFAAYPCSTWENFDKTKCLTCPGSGCSRMGYHADKHPGRGSLYLKTGDATASSTCRYSYALRLTVSRTIRGMLNVDLIGQHGRTGIVTITKDATVVRSSVRDAFSAMIMSTADIGDISSVRLSYDRTGSLLTSWLYSAELWIASLSVQNPRTLTEYRYCGTSGGVPENRFAILTRC